MKFTQVVEILNNHQIRFYVTSGFAVYIYTGKRVFDDVDIVVSRVDIEKIEGLFGQKFTQTVFANGTATHLRLSPVVEIACFDEILVNGRKLSLKFDDKIYKNSQLIQIAQQNVRIVPIEELVILKLALNRSIGNKSDPKDIKLLLKSNRLNYFKLIARTIQVGLTLRLAKILFTHG